MRSVCYGEITLADEKSSAELRQVDCECAQCLYDAGKITAQDALAAVIENELTEAEKDAVRLYWFSKMKISKIAEKRGVSYDYVRRLLKRAEKKIYTSLKYVVLYNYMICGSTRLPSDFHFKIIDCIDGRELVS